MGSYLRTNYRISGKELDINAIGGGIALASYVGSAGTRREYGGFIMGSISASVVGEGATITASEAMSMYYGSALFGNGYRIMPIVAHQVGTGTAFIVHGSCDDAGDSNIYFSFIALTVDAASNPIPGPVVGGVEAHIVWAGFIISGP